MISEQTNIGTFAMNNDSCYCDRSQTFDSSDPTKFAGIDIGSKSNYVCIVHKGGKTEVREYPVFTSRLKECASWLAEHGVKSIAMESTGVYWIPLFDILESRGFEVILANAAHLKNVPGRKSDVQDCQWIQRLHSNGLLRGSFRPTNEILPLRAYVRTRSQLIQQSASHVRRMQKALIQMNIQLGLAIRDIKGVTGLKIIKAILAGERDPYKLASLRHGCCRKNVQEIAEALEGNWLEEHLFGLELAYDDWEATHQRIERCEQRIKSELLRVYARVLSLNPDQGPLVEELEAAITPTKGKMPCRLNNYGFDLGMLLQAILGVDCTAIPGVSASTLLTFVAECGLDMSKWKMSKHFASWLGVCPKNKITGGGVISSRTLPSKNRIGLGLRMSAMTVARSNSALGALFRRTASRVGGPKAITAVAHKLAVTLYKMIRDRCEYDSTLTAAHDEAHKAYQIKRLRRQAEALGYRLAETNEAD